MTGLRVGHGYDVHRLAQGRPLILGGVTIPWEKGLDGHSDADVLTHAVMDALLGAAGMDDIGRLFPDCDNAFLNISSLTLLERVMKALQEFLRPEFINRVDEIVYFHQLTEENFRGIAGIMLEELKAALEEKGYHFTYDDALVDYLVEKSYSLTYGARNLRRTIQKELEDVMAAQIIDSYEHPVTQIHASMEDGKLVVRSL